jgi:hypothetical protein
MYSKCPHPRRFFRFTADTAWMWCGCGAGVVRVWHGCGEFDASSATRRSGSAVPGAWTWQHAHAMMRIFMPAHCQIKTRACPPNKTQLRVTPYDEFGRADRLGAALALDGNTPHDLRTALDVIDRQQ